MKTVRTLLTVCAAATLSLGTADAQTLSEAAGLPDRPHMSFNGTPGLIDMPSAFAMADADFALTYSRFGVSTKGTLAFQISPRLTGVFRYSRFEDFFANNPNNLNPDPDLYDRSFDILYSLAQEGRIRPAIALGIRDFGGTGILESEYIVASKTVAETFKVSAGLGWGRLASEGGFTNPLGALSSNLETRPADRVNVQDTGRFDVDRLFRGDAALFGGVEWNATDKLTLVAEYSSDAYEQEVRRSGFERNSSLNYGLTYAVSPASSVGAYYLYGSEIGVRFSYALNPKVPPAASGVEPGPQPVQPRPNRRTSPDLWSTGWTQVPSGQTTIQQAVIGVLSPEGLLLEELDLSGTAARVSMRNTRFDQSAQAVGRAARALTRALPASVERLEIVLVTGTGVPTTKVTLARSDLEELEFAPDNAWQSLVRAKVADAADVGTAPASATSPRLTFGLNSYIAQSFFDPDQPLLFDIGVLASTRYEMRPGWVLNADIRQPLFGNRDTTNRESNSVLPFVRSEQDDFNRGNGPKLDRLTLARYGRPGKDLYGRVTAGYLELAYMGLSGEVLWKPVDSRLALGVELNAVHQRQPGDAFAMGEGIFDNDAITGHASMYYAFENGFHTQLDVGRYLAEDWGGTFTLTREFGNGWQVGAFFTLTDVGFDDFGEGAFDKGIFFTLPVAWSLGQPSRQSRPSVIRPVLRDGGARVRVPDRLYDMVRQDSDPLLSDGWGRFWR